MTFGNPSFVDIYHDQTGGAFACHKSASPTAARVKELFIAPKHLQVAPDAFLQSNL